MFKRLMKVFAVFGVLSLVLTACMSIDMRFKVNPDKSVDSIQEFTADLSVADDEMSQMFLKQMLDEMFAEAQAEASGNDTVEKIEEGNLYGWRTTSHGAFEDMNDFGDAGGTGGFVDRGDGTIEFRVNFPAGTLDELEGLSDMGDLGMGEGEVFSAFTISVELPGAISSADDRATVNGNVVSWSVLEVMSQGGEIFAIGSMAPGGGGSTPPQNNTDAQVDSGSGSEVTENPQETPGAADEGGFPWIWVIIGAIVLLLIIILVIILIVASRRKKNNQQQALYGQPQGQYPPQGQYLPQGGQYQQQGQFPPQPQAYPPQQGGQPPQQAQPYSPQQTQQYPPQANPGQQPPQQDTGQYPPAPGQNPPNNNGGQYPPQP